MADNSHHHNHRNGNLRGSTSSSLAGSDPQGLFPSTSANRQDANSLPSPAGAELASNPPRYQRATSNCSMTNSLNDDTATITSFSSCIDDANSLASPSRMVHVEAMVAGGGPAPSVQQQQKPPVVPSGLGLIGAPSAGRPQPGREVVRFQNCSKYHGSRFNKKQVFNNFNLSLREGEM